ncbi:transmembrane emp24 domain-containing protein 7-like [Rhopilema esculentum]|uniref:transmembrane emp24 domain-containing protein 7-like n=1 Tax=Rhopilema esculentum TaxID=499914 RepID=UPI0031D1EDC4|eukprot:gene13593-4489_t
MGCLGLVTGLLLASVLSTTNARHVQFFLNGWECFFEDITVGQTASIEFAPITGSKPHVDVTLEDPTGRVIYRVYQKEYEYFKFPVNVTGTYKICFSNIYDFSMYNNLIYLDFVVGDENALHTGTDKKGQTGPMTQLETSIVNIHDSMRVAELYQNHHRIREANGRLVAEGLYEKVVWWSLGQTMIIVLIGIGQVLLLRSFFAVKKEQI